MAESETRTTEFIGVSVPKGWKGRLKKQHDGNLSKAVSVAIAGHNGWRYDIANRATPTLRLDVVSSLPKSHVADLLSDRNDVSLGTVEVSTLSPIRVVLTDKETGETSDKRGSNDRRKIVKQAAAIAKLIKSKS